MRDACSDCRVLTSSHPEPCDECKKRRRRRAAWDVITAARGHLRGEDWDKEMREALAEFDASDPDA